MPLFDAATLDGWLAHLESLHPNTIDMGLARVGKVRDAMGLFPVSPVITVGGTNGKGSVCAMLSAIFKAAGYRVGTYTSPHLLHYNERVMIDLQPASDEALLAGFRAVEAARGDTALTYFEFGTLAAMRQFVDAGVDVAVLEIGLGGRLDAVNVFEPDAAAVVSVALDHEAWLGNTREAVGFEKAGIYRAGKVAVCADPEPPHSLLDHAKTIGADLRLIGCDFGFSRQAEEPVWSWWGRGGVEFGGLPMPALQGSYQLGNAATALALLDAVKDSLPVNAEAVRQGLQNVRWPARFQVLPGHPAVILDVGHNPHAARVLRANLEAMKGHARTLAVFGMMQDKDIAGVIGLLADCVDSWYVAAPALPRAASAAVLTETIGSLAPHAAVECHESIAQAWYAACKEAGEDDRILAFGSFYTVAEVMAASEC
ncbi:dihydrofolate synthase / folylpolyglutamate synthase [Formivibrio citricus]|uniref:Dihydrofolate synthase/folylpolyglutamate synthase n=1 Tax=Formivibrio citricus TaxID=83765 RepID=A0A1I4V9E0_9NEIS|nr:bifunctional tetrahydrofolate synthase/dihydrofolate synthase [Formivibrio citricus]SFM97785.1 dihydrofolate synthase / folylpolyglutamate synthase [Formivibrio citricus]